MEEEAFPPSDRLEVTLQKLLCKVIFLVFATHGVAVKRQSELAAGSSHPCFNPLRSPLAAGDFNPGHYSGTVPAQLRHTSSTCYTKHAPAQFQHNSGTVPAQLQHSPNPAPTQFQHIPGTTPEHAKMSRLHNDANILALGSRMTDYDVIIEIIDIWLNTKFEGGRHSRRVNKIEVSWTQI